MAPALPVTMDIAMETSRQAVAARLLVAVVQAGAVPLVAGVQPSAGQAGGSRRALWGQTRPWEGAVTSVRGMKSHRWTRRSRGGHTSPCTLGQQLGTNHWPLSPSAAAFSAGRGGVIPECPGLWPLCPHSPCRWASGLQLTHLSVLVTPH